MRLSEEELTRIMQREGYKEIDHAAYAIPADGDDYTYSEELPDVGKEKKRHKYGARKTEVDGIMFDSAAEAKRYKTLKLLESAGEIHDLALQPKFTLQEPFEFRGVKYRGIGYRADFKYTKRNGQTVVEDVKGKQTTEFKLKWKMLLYIAKGYNSQFEFVIVNGKDA